MICFWIFLFNDTLNQIDIKHSLWMILFGGVEL